MTIARTPLSRGRADAHAPGALRPGRPRRSLWALACAALVLAACSQGNSAPVVAAGSAPAAATGASPAGRARTGDSAQTASGPPRPTPGAANKTLTFTAAQVVNGGVRWARVTTARVATLATIPGEVTPNEDRTVRLGAPGPGRIVAVRVQPGQRVSRGQVLVVLQSPQASAAQADVNRATSELTSWQARAQYADAARARATRLLALKAIPLQDYERSVVDDEEAHASLLQAKSEVTRATTTAGQLGAGSGSPSGDFVIRSPMNGVVLARTAVPGAVVDAGAPLIVITDPSSLWLSMNPAEQFALLFRDGDNVRFTVPAYPADTFSARIDAVGAGLDSATRTLPVRGVITNVRRLLKPRMLASVVVAGGTPVPATLVPDDAVQSLGGKPTVFLAQPDGQGGARFEAREVTVGSRIGGRTAVTGGLAPGEVIVTAGAFALKAELKKAAILTED